jgi:GntR family transcriptional regulator
MIGRNNESQAIAMSMALQKPDQLDPNSPIPLYHQLKERIQAKIDNGDYQPGQMIPTERELQETYGISRITVRNAIAELVAEERIIKKQGQGTLVAKPRIVDDSSRLRGFTEKSMAQGAQIEDVGTRVLHVERLAAQPRICAYLGLPFESPVLYVKRLRMLQEEPIAVFENYIRGDMGIEADEDFSHSLYELYERGHGLSIAWAERCIEASAIESDRASLLGLREGEPVLIIKNTTFLSDGCPIEYAEGVYRADRYKYIVQLKR